MLGPAGLHIFEGRIVEKPGQRVDVGQIFVVFQLGLFVAGLPDAVEHDAAQLQQKAKQAHAVKHRVLPPGMVSIKEHQCRCGTDCQCTKADQNIPHVLASGLFIRCKEVAESQRDACKDGQVHEGQQPEHRPAPQQPAQNICRQQEHLYLLQEPQVPALLF